MTTILALLSATPLGAQEPAAPTTSEPARVAAAGEASEGAVPESAAAAVRTIYIEHLEKRLGNWSPGDTWDSDVLRSVWRSESFQRRFAESYLSESDIEPKLTPAEATIAQEILALINEDKTDEAIARLETARTQLPVEENRDRRIREPEQPVPTVPNALFDFMLGNIHFQAERLEPAAAAYQSAIDKHPKFLRAWKNLALVHVRRADFESAQPALIKVISLGGGDGLAFGLLGYAHASLEDDLAAESAYRMAILLDPVTADWKMGLARSLFRQERYADVAALMNRLIAAQPDRADLWLLQANAYIGLRQPLKAAENYQIVDRMGGSSVDSLNMLGDIYTNESLFDLAVPAYIRAMELEPSASPDRALTAARVLTARGALAESRTLLETIERLRAGALSEESRKEILRMRARIAVAEGAGDEEAALLEQIVALDPLDGEALILLGQHAARNEQPEEAIFYYERAAGLEKFEPDAKVRHAQLLVRQQKYGEALPLLRAAQQINPRQNVQEFLEQVERLASRR